jgi:ComF family protein
MDGFKSYFKRVTSYILDLLYPPRCIFCGILLPVGTKLEICDTCYEKMPMVGGKVCETCGQPMDEPYGPEQCLDCRKTTLYFIQNLPVYEYKGIVRQAIMKLKFYNKKRVARTLGILMADKIKQMTSLPKFDIITYIPLSKKRLAQRGYNQSKLLCSVIAEELNFPISENVLWKVKDTPPQSTLNRDERQHNIKNAFMVKDKYSIKDMIILLVDDIYTTGRTVNECSRLLKKAGAKEIYVVTAAIGKGIY